MCILTDSVSSDSDADEVSEKNESGDFSPAHSELGKDEKPTVDPLDEPIPKISHMLKENDRNQAHPFEALKSETDVSEQGSPVSGRKNDPKEEIKRETEKSPKGKGRRSRARDSSGENAKLMPLNLDEILNEHFTDSERLGGPCVESKGLSVASETEIDPYVKEKKLLKRKLEQQSPDKRVRLESKMEVPNSVSEAGRTRECCGTEACQDLSVGDSVRSGNAEMPSLVAESDQRLHVRRGENLECSSREKFHAPLKDDDGMPQIGPETLLCHEVDLDDLDEKDKSEPDSATTDKQDLIALGSNPPALPPVGQPNFSVASPLALSQDESRSIKSESDITIEVDSVAEESQEGLCESESANGFEACTTSSNCSIAVPEREVGERGEFCFLTGILVLMNPKKDCLMGQVTVTTAKALKGLFTSHTVPAYTLWRMYCTHSHIIFAHVNQCMCFNCISTAIHLLLKVSSSIRQSRGRNCCWERKGKEFIFIDKDCFMVVLGTKAANELPNVTHLLHLLWKTLLSTRVSVWSYV